jgi:sugar phosphate isomerase/epimerase
MEKTGVNVLIENSTKKNLGAYYYFFTGEQMVDFLKYANHPLLHAVWDTGHGNTEGGQYEQLMALGKELYGVHIHDNSEHGDEHTMPYFGTLNMDDVMNGLIDSGYQGYFTFEVVAALRKSGSRHGKRHTFERDTRLLEPTMEMQMDLERLMYTIGKHCLTSYGMFEE